MPSPAELVRELRETLVGQPPAPGGHAPDLRVLPALIRIVPNRLLLHAVELAVTVPDARLRGRTLGAIAVRLEGSLDALLLPDQWEGAVVETALLGMALEALGPYLPHARLDEAAARAREIPDDETSSAALKAIESARKRRRRPVPPARARPTRIEKLLGLLPGDVRDALVEEALYNRWLWYATKGAAPPPFRTVGPEDLIRVTVRGDVSGQVSVGKDESGERPPQLVEANGPTEAKEGSGERPPLLVEGDGPTEADRGETRAMPPPRHTTRAKPPSREDYVNRGFADSDTGDLRANQPLTSGRPYYFWLSIGRRDPHAVGDAAVLPKHLLPEEARLVVALYSFDDGLEIEPGADLGELQLRKDGTVEVTRPVGDRPPPAIPAVAPESLAQRLVFPVRAPDRDGVARLRCNIYCQQVLVQAHLISARVMLHPQPEDRALDARVDYTLSRSLSAAHVGAASPHRLSLMVNESGDTHHLSLLATDGQELFTDGMKIDVAQLGSYIRIGRGALRRISWNDEDEWAEGKPDRFNPDVPRSRAEREQQFRGDVVSLARAGWRLYDKLRLTMKGGPASADRLAAIMHAPGRSFVQIALVEAATHVFPAALLYDYPFDTNKGATVCSAFLEDLAADVPLAQQRCMLGACPTRDQEQVVCPSGFWGFRHAIGMPLSTQRANGGGETEHDAPFVLAGLEDPRVAASAWRDLSLREEHFSRLRKLRPSQFLEDAETRDEAIALLRRSTPHVVYFYCHAGIKGEIPYIEIGVPGDPVLSPDNIGGTGIGWQSPGPVVFINGCRSTAVEPDKALEFVTEFIVGARAAGVIGTEITVFEPMASAFAETCLAHFLNAVENGVKTGVEIGEAIRLARLALLQQYNPLGLVYIPFVVASLRLVPSSH